MSSINHLITEIEKFSSYTGLTLNPEKCEIFPVQQGNEAITNALPYKLQKHTIKLLGISLGRDKQQTNNDNVDNKLANIIKTLDR